MIIFFLHTVAAQALSFLFILRPNRNARSEIWKTTLDFLLHRKTPKCEHRQKNYLKSSFKNLLTALGSTND